MNRYRGDIEGFHSAFFNVIARVFPNLEHLHYGLPPQGGGSSNWPGTLRRLRQGSERLLDRLVDVADLDSLPAGARGLDLGCGLGGTALFLARRCGLHMTGLNINAKQLAIARGHVREQREERRVSLVRGDACSLPFVDEWFDLVVLIEVAFHVRDKATLMAEVARVLRPGGRLVLVDQECSEPMEVMELFFFVPKGSYRLLGQQVGLTVSVEVDLSSEVAVWMRDYVRLASIPFQAGAALLALARGGPALAWQYARGVCYFNRLILEHVERHGQVITRPGPVNAIKALRQHTEEELERGGTCYKVIVMRRER